MPHFVSIWKYRIPSKLSSWMLPVRSSHADTKFEGISLLYHEYLSAASVTSVAFGCWISAQPSSMAVMLWIWNSSWHPTRLCFFSLVSWRWKSSHLMLWFPLPDTVEIAMELHESFPRTVVGVSWKLDLTTLQTWPAGPQKCCGYLWWFAGTLKILHISLGCMAKIM